MRLLSAPVMVISKHIQARIPFSFENLRPNMDSLLGRMGKITGQ